MCRAHGHGTGQGDCDEGSSAIAALGKLLLVGKTRENTATRDSVIDAVACLFGGVGSSGKMSKCRESPTTSCAK